MERTQREQLHFERRFPMRLQTSFYGRLTKRSDIPAYVLPELFQTAKAISCVIETVAIDVAMNFASE